MAWRIVSVSWRSALDLAISWASSKLAPLTSRAVSSIPSALADPFGEGGRAVVVGEEAAGGFLDLVVDHLEDHFLGRCSLEQALPERVDALSLLVHDFVVFEQVFADVEVALLDLLLSAFDPPADHLALDGFAFLHSQPGEHGRDPFAGKLAHQVVFERQEETR